MQWCLHNINYPATNGTTRSFTSIGMNNFPTNCFIVVPVYHSQSNQTHGAATVSRVPTNFVLTTDGSTLGFYYFAIGN